MKDLALSDTNHDDCRRVLEPFLEMLEEKGKTLSQSEWRDLVNFTKQRILNAPEQYLSVIPKPIQKLEDTIERIFQERLN